MSDLSIDPTEPEPEYDPEVELAEDTEARIMHIFHEAIVAFARQSDPTVPDYAVDPAPWLSQVEDVLAEAFRRYRHLLVTGNAAGPGQN